MFKMNTLATFLTILLCPFSTFQLAAASGNRIAIENVTVIDAINGTREGQTVIFSDDNIIAVQPAGRPISVDKKINGEGKFLIPGLWDFHVHLTYDDRFKEDMPALFLSYGITSVRDTGGLLDKLLPVVKKMREAKAVAPRVYYAGPLLDGKTVVYDGKSVPEIGMQNLTPQDATDHVAALKRHGADFIKIYELVDPDIFAALVAAANKQNMPIDAHIPLSMLARTAGPLVDSMEHLRNIELDCTEQAEALLDVRTQLIDNPGQLSGYQLRASMHTQQRLAAVADYSEARCDETLAALASTVQVPTLRLNTVRVDPPYERSGWKQALSSVPLSVQEEWQQLLQGLRNSSGTSDTRFADWSLFLTRRMNDKNIPIAAGTDTPIGLSVPGFSLHSELEMLVKAGLTPRQALAAATVIPARYFSLQESMGTIDVGKRADMVLLDHNPLEDIRNTKSIVAVISKGRYWKVDALRALLSNH